MPHYRSIFGTMKREIAIYRRIRPENTIPSSKQRTTNRSSQPLITEPILKEI